MAPKSTTEVLDNVKSALTQLKAQDGGKPKRGAKSASKSGSKTKKVKASSKSKKAKSKSQSRPKKTKKVASKAKKTKSKSKSQSRPKTAKKATKAKATKTKSKSKSRSMKRAPNQYIIDLTALRSYIKEQLPKETLNNVGAMSSAAAKILSGADKDLAKAKKAFSGPSFMKDYKAADEKIKAKRQAKKDAKA